MAKRQHISSELLTKTLYFEVVMYYRFVIQFIITWPHSHVTRRSKFVGRMELSVGMYLSYLLCSYIWCIINRVVFILCLSLTIF